jgi:Family of unknown function (DUF5677)
MAHKKNKRRIKRPQPRKAQRVPLPKTRLGELFTTMSAATAAGDHALAQTAADESEPVRFDAEVLMRGVNALKSARLLLEQAHWETAAGPVRQLFELLINLEHIAAAPDREAAVFRYAKFGLMQTVRSQRTQLSYEEATGRPVDKSRVAILDNMLEHTFPEFRKVTAKGKVVWDVSWCGKNVKALAKSSGSPMRDAQYEQLFVLWSEQVHAAPAALMGAIFPSGGPPDIAEIVADDNRHVVETGSMAVTLFIELWRTLPTVAPLDARAMLEWTTGLIRQAIAVGAPFSIDPGGASL